MTPRGRCACQRITPDQTGAHRNEPHSKSNEPCRTGHIQSQLPLAGSHLILAADASSHRLSLSESPSFSSDDDENRRATRINPRRGGQHSTVNHHRKASKAAHSSLKSIAYRHHRPSAVSTVSGRIRVLSLAVSYPYVIYVYLRTLNNASVGLGSYASVRCAGHAERASRR